MAKAEKTIKVRQIASTIGATTVQRATIIGLGLKKVHAEKVLKDTPEVRGMVSKVSHLVKIVED